MMFIGLHRLLYVFYICLQTCCMLFVCFKNVAIVFNLLLLFFSVVWRAL